MIVALGFHAGDTRAAYDLLLWISQLGGGCQQHDLILIADAGVQWTDAVDVLEAAQKAFRHTQIIATEKPIIGWPAGANELWLTAAKEAKQLGQFFLWLEPDCVPLVPGWLDKIQAQVCAGRFLGHIYDTNDPSFPPKVMSGVAVYPADAIDQLLPYWNSRRAWDIACAPAMLKAGKHTKLIQHFWGQPDLAPTFISNNIHQTAINELRLDKINTDAVLFHRCKDRSLIGLLRAKYGLDSPEYFAVVLPFCNHDAACMLRLLEWATEMPTPKTHQAVLSYDQTIGRDSLRRIRDMASRTFDILAENSYSLPRGVRFPQTYAFQQAARFMEQINRAWIWLEADCVPLKPTWLTALQREYDRCGKPFCGPVVQGRGHCNGTAIYPPDTPSRMPRTMSHTENAWDVECVDEIKGQVHDCRALWQLAWGVIGGNRLDELSGAELPSFPRNSPLLAQIRPEAVLFHRDKSGTLIQRLRERK